MESCPFHLPGLYIFSIVNYFMFIYCKECNVTWFGYNCKQKCRCQEGRCKDDGSCFKNYNCDPLYFGPQCQFRLINYRNLPILSDGDDSTCLESSYNNKSMQLLFDEDIKFTWLRIIHKFESQDNLSLHYVEVTSKEVETCDSMKLFRIDSLTLDIACDINSTLSQLHVGWDSHLSPCSVYISAGMNLLLHQNITASSEELKTSGYILNDGDYVPKSRCIEPHKNMTPIDWSILFDQPKKINYLVIHSSFVFLVSAYGVQSNVTLFHKVHNSGDPSIFVIPLSTASYISRILLMVYPRQNKDTSLCEVEAFGDCSPPKYGLTCSQICSQDCVGQRCHHDGQCFEEFWNEETTQETSVTSPMVTPATRIDTSYIFIAMFLCTLVLAGSFCLMVCLYRVHREMNENRRQSISKTQTFSPLFTASSSTMTSSGILSSHPTDDTGTSHSTSATTAISEIHVRTARFKYPVRRFSIASDNRTKL